MSYVAKQVVSRADVPPSTAAPVFSAGTKVLVYTDGKSVLDVQPYPVDMELADHVRQIGELQTQIASLRSTVEKLVPPARVQTPPATSEKLG